MALIPPVWGDGKGMSPQEVARQRMMAEALLRPSKQPMTHWMQGVNELAEGLIGGFKNRRANEAESENNKRRNDAYARILKASSDVDPASINGPPLASSLEASLPPAGGAMAAAQETSAPASGNIRDGIASTASALGIDPVDLATAISYETAGTFDPTKRGPTTQWGQHRGLIQFGEPQAQKYGVDWNDPLGSQLGPNGAVANYLRDTGVKPGMGLLDIYSAINAGGVGRYNRSDANNGGAPGTVADKVNSQMAGHRQKAMAMFAGQQPTQVASLDPSAGMTASVPAAPRQAIASQLIGNTPQPQVAQAGGIDRAMIAQLLGDPATEDLGQSLIMQLVEQQQAYGQREAEWAREDAIRQQGFSREDAQNAQEQARWEAEFGLKSRPEPQKPTSDIQEYEYAVRQGFRGTFADYQQAVRKAGATNINMPGQPNIGTIPPGWQATQDAAGSWTMAPIEGGPAAAEAQTAANAEANRLASEQSRSSLILEEIDRAINTMDTGILPDTGVGAYLANVPGTDAKALGSLLETVKANIGFAELNKMRQESPTGGALGNVTERELAYLQSVAGNLDQAQSSQQLKDNLNRLWNAYQDVVHGNGKGPERRPLSFQQKPIQLDEVVVPSGVDPEDWKFMSEEDKALWQ